MEPSEPFEMFPKARDDTMHELHRLEEKQQTVELLSTDLDVLARARHALGLGDWEQPAKDAIVLLDQQIKNWDAHPYERIGDLYAMAGDYDRSRPFYEKSISKAPDLAAHSLLMLGLHEQFIEALAGDNYGSAHRFRCVEMIINADSAADRVTILKAANELLDSPGFNPWETVWYLPLQSRLKTRGRFGRPLRWPSREPRNIDVQNWKISVETLGPLSAAAQFAALKAGRPTDPEPFIQLAEQLDAQEVPPGPLLFHTKAGLHRLLGEQVKSTSCLEEMLDHHSQSARDVAAACIVLGRQNGLTLDVIKGAGNDMVSAYARLAEDATNDQAWEQLTRHSKRLSPAASSIDLRPQEVLALAKERFG